MQHLEVNGAVRPIYGSLGVKRLKVRPTPQVFYKVLLSHVCYCQFKIVVFTLTVIIPSPSIAAG